MLGSQFVLVTLYCSLQLVLSKTIRIGDTYLVYFTQWNTYQLSSTTLYAHHCVRQNKGKDQK